ncbi:MAG: uroporphyrinogen decarboxylase family protein [Thermoproteota archaeon]
MVIEFEEHNDKVRKLWNDFQRGIHERVPVSWSMSYKMLLLDSKLNRSGLTFERCFKDPDAMLKAQLDFEYWRRHNVWADWEMGLPERWDIGVNFQNVYESAWLGGEIYYAQNQVPDINPFLKNYEEMNEFIKSEIPDPFSGFMGKVRRFYDHFLKKREEGFTYSDRPLGEISLPIGTDGPFTIAMNVTGGNILKFLHKDPDFFENFLQHINVALIERMKVWHKVKGLSFPYEGFGFADDSIQLLSPKAYERFVLPLHKEIVKTFCTGRPSIHLCGDINHLLEIIRRELKIKSIDSGYPLDLKKARDILGDDVVIRGNLHVMTLLNGPMEKIRAETLQILQSGVLKGKMFIFGEGNNVAPLTPAENMNYAYRIVRELGVLR